MQVPVLPAEGFEPQVKALGRALVLFTASWCGYCARFEPAFREAAAKAPPGLAFAVADISDDDTDPRWDRYGIEVVPTVLAFEDGAVKARLDGVRLRGLQPRDLAALVRAQAP